MSLNSVVLIGRLGQEPELKYTPSGVALAKFSLAVDRNTTKDEQGRREVDWIPCTAWRQAAEFAANYLGKGRLVAVEGRAMPPNRTIPLRSRERSYPVKLMDLLSQMRDGQAEHDLAEAIRALVHSVQQTGKSGSLTLTLKAQSAGRDRITVSDTISSKTPKPETEETIFYCDDDGNLSRRDPRQLTLSELREP